MVLSASCALAQLTHVLLYGLSVTLCAEWIAGWLLCIACKLMLDCLRAAQQTGRVPSTS